MFNSDTSMKPNFETKPPRKHQDSYLSESKYKYYYDTNTYNQRNHYKKRRRGSKDYSYQRSSSKYYSYSSNEPYKRKHGNYKRHKYDDFHRPNHYRSKSFSSSQHYHHLKDASRRKSDQYEIESEGGEDLIRKEVELEENRSTDHKTNQLSYFSLIKLELLSFFDEKESCILTIEEEYKALKAEKEELLQQIQKAQQSLKQEELIKHKATLKPVYHPKKFDLINTVRIPTPSFEKAYKEPKDYPFYNNNIITHQRIKQKLKAYIVEKQCMAIKSHSEYLKLYQEQMSKWKLFVRHKEEEEATQQYFASKRYLIEQQYGDRVIRSRRTKETSKVQQQKRRQSIKQEQHRLYEKERFEANRADIPSMNVFVPHSFEKWAYQFIDNNGCIEGNPSVIEKIYQRYHPWSKEEQQCFVALFKKYRKDFKAIASYFPTKTIKDVIWFYYMKKYELGLRLTYEFQSYSEDMIYKPPKESEIYIMRKPSFDGDDLYDEDVDITGTSNEEEDEDIDIVGDVDIGLPMVNNLNLNCNDEKISVSVEEVNNPMKVDMKHDEFLVEKNCRNNHVKTKSHWNDDEKELFKEYLKQYGKDWEKIAAIIKTKTSSQVKNYFQNYRIKLNLYELLPEDQKTKAKSRKKRIAECKAEYESA